MIEIITQIFLNISFLLFDNYLVELFEIEIESKKLWVHSTQIIHNAIYITFILWTVSIFFQIWRKPTKVWNSPNWARRPSSAWKCSESHIVKSFVCFRMLTRISWFLSPNHHICSGQYRSYIRTCPFVHANFFQESETLNRIRKTKREMNACVSIQT